MNKIGVVFVLKMFYVLTCLSQTQLSGIIIDEKNEGLADVSISLQGFKVGVKSLSDGSFIIPVTDSTGALELSMIGYLDKTVGFSSKDISEGIFVQMQVREEELEEVNIVSTGYQELPKERSTGAFHLLSEENLNEQVSTNILDRLEAIANGVSFNRTIINAPGLTIRGISSIEGSKKPLIVVDNFPYEGEIENLNPNDVADITLLKDAAASSIWGARAGNGVIVITTKSGSFNQPLNITANASMTVSSKPDLYYLPTLSSAEYIEVEKFLFSNEHKFSDTLSRSHVPFTPVYELLFEEQKGIISKAEVERKIDKLKKTDLRNEYLNTMYRPSFNQQYAVNISGGAERSTWYFSSGYDRNINEKYDTYQRFNFNFQNTYQPVKNLEIRTGIRYTNSSDRNGRIGYGDIRMNNRELPPYTAFKDENGDFLPITLSYRQQYVDTVGRGQLLDWNYYMNDYTHVKNTGQLSDIVVNAGANYKIMDWLNFDIKYQFEKQQSDRAVIYGEQSHFSRSMVNQYTQLQPGLDPVYIVPPGAIYDPSIDNMTSHSLRSQTNIQYGRGVHNIAGLIGLEGRSISANINNSRYYGYDPKVGTYTDVDLTRTHPSIVTGANSFIPNISGFANRENRFLSVFANGAYTYNEKYIFSFSSRRDASNLFGVNTNDKWNLLWSVGAAWNINKEEFYKIDWLPYTKLRFTYGISGNVDLNRSALTTINYAALNNPFTQQKIARFDQFGDPELRWEKVSMTNVALDFGSGNNRLSGSVDFFFKRGDDLFGPTEIDYTTGTSTTLTKNVAALKGKGADIMLNSININTSKLKWNTNLNFSWYKDEIINYFRSEVNGRFYVTGEVPSLTGIVGKPLYSFYSYKWKGLDSETGDPVGYIDGKESKNYNAINGDSTFVSDLIYSGSATPIVYGSLGNTFNWKSLSLSFRFLYNFGYYYRRSTINYYNLFSVGTDAHSEYKDRWVQSGDELGTSVPSMVYPANTDRDRFYRSSEINVRRGDHIRFQYITLSYDLFKEREKKIKSLQQANIYINAANLGVVWTANKEGVDPEYRRSSPPPLTISIGTRLTF